jgi:hypothetical protein
MSATNILPSHGMNRTHGKSDRLLAYLIEWICITVAIAKALSSRKKKEFLPCFAVDHVSDRVTASQLLEIP